MEDPQHRSRASSCMQTSIRRAQLLTLERAPHRETQAEERDRKKTNNPALRKHKYWVK